MAHTGTVLREKMTVGDTAVNGLLNGLLAGVAMAGYLFVAMGINGESPADTLSRFGPSGGASSPLIGALSHLAMSAIYGMLFAVNWRWFARGNAKRGVALLAGLIYAGLLFAVAAFFLLPAVGSPLLDIRLHFGIGHVVYGAALGMLTRRP